MFFFFFSSSIFRVHQIRCASPVDSPCWLYNSASPRLNLTHLVQDARRSQPVPVEPSWVAAESDADTAGGNTGLSRPTNRSGEYPLTFLYACFFLFCFFIFRNYLEILVPGAQEARSKRRQNPAEFEVRLSKGGSGDQA